MKRSGRALPSAERPGAGLSVERVMVRRVVSCFPHESLRVAARRLRDFDVGALTVVDGRGVLIGILTDRDLALAQLRHEALLGEVKVAEVMVRRPRSCRLDEDVEAALGLMSQWRVRRIPVVDEAGVLHGIVTLDDLARAALGPSGGPSARSVLRVLVDTGHFTRADSRVEDEPGRTDPRR